jgi:hypothetical protein
MRLRLTLPCALTLVACNALTEPPPEAEDPTQGSSDHGGGFAVAPPSIGSVGGRPVTGPAAEPVVTSAVPPVPIQGGTLLVMRDGHTAVAADPDRDRVLIADLTDAEVLATLELQPGDEPGRLVEDDNGRVHIVLRRSGVIATLDVAARALTERRDVCLAPQGIAYAASLDALLVACAEGDLVELPAAGGARTRVTRVDADLRDVIVTGERVLVSRFKSAELIELDADRRIAKRSRSTDIQAPFASISDGPRPPDPSDSDVLEAKTFSAGVAFRTLEGIDGRALMLHQRAQSSEIDLQTGDIHSEDGASAGSAGGSAMEPIEIGGEGSAYGGGGGLCSSIVRPALSVEGPEGMTSGPVLPAATLAVDAALSPDGRWVAVGVAGSPDASQATFGMFARVSALVLSTDTVVTTATAEDETGECVLPGSDAEGSVISTEQVVAVAFDASNRLVMQTREPATLQIVADVGACSPGPNGGFGCGTDIVIPFGGEARADTGHDLFHSDAGAGLACASCHPGGADDGHTWVFSDLGPRRTQLFNMGIDKTLPLHWDGDLPTFTDLVKEVFVRRMGGADLGAAHITVMENWISTLEPGTPLRLSTDPAVERGKALFESSEVACATCHVGPMFTNNMTVDVGSGDTLQVPSLIGVAHHAPWMHTGCAQTLRQRFDPECGGDKHGNTSHLEETQLDDLVAYLESL